MFKCFIALFSLSSLAIGVTTEIKLPTRLECRWGNHSDRLYTRLEKITNLAQLPGQNSPMTVWGEGAQSETPKKDEVAFGWIGDYYKASVSLTQYSYDLWTCDSEDRSYVFQTADLILDAASSQLEKTLKGKLIIGVREQESRFDLECLAQY